MPTRLSRTCLPLILLALPLFRGCVGIESHAIPGPASVTDQGSTARFLAQASRLKGDIERTVEWCHWGLLHIRQDGQTLRAAAVLPNSRDAQVTVELGAGPDTQRDVAVTVKVGPFGDPEWERVFLDNFRGSLREKARPVRDRGFTLPD
ncbi:MAG: hypothetical protein GC164_14415 [Phycisphaera sp.]|nr:hypothetical protein [Phycisphaera sp.]